MVYILWPQAFCYKNVYRWQIEIMICSSSFSCVQDSMITANYNDKLNFNKSTQSYCRSCSKQVGLTNEGTISVITNNYKVFGESLVNPIKIK